MKCRHMLRVQLEMNLAKQPPQTQTIPALNLFKIRNIFETHKRNMYGVLSLSFVSLG